MYKSKHITAFTAALAICSGTLSHMPHIPQNMAVLAAEDTISASGECGENLTWEIKGDTLTISGFGQ
jgi:hypothetical protein